MLEYVINYMESSGNGVWCEDKCLLTNLCVGVLDGATPIDRYPVLQYPTQAAWFTDAFAKKLYRMEDTGNTSMRQRCKAITKELQSELDVWMEPYNRPCATAVLLSKEGAEISLLTIGDCHAYVLHQSGEIQHISDDRAAEYSGQTLIAANQAQGDPQRFAQSVRDQKIENRKQLNREGGFYAVALDEAYEQGFMENRFQEEDISQILLCSDGFARMFLEYALITPRAFFDSGISLPAAMAQLRAYEEDNAADHSRCVKRADDAAAVLLHF